MDWNMVHDEVEYFLSAVVFVSVLSNVLMLDMCNLQGLNGLFL
jgi:hypothetical protein